MIAVPLIDWQPLEMMPESRKDGRLVLVWSGDGPVIVTWIDRPAWPEGGIWVMPHDRSLPIDATHWADINPPE